MLSDRRATQVIHAVFSSEVKRRSPCTQMCNFFKAARQYMLVSTGDYKEYILVSYVSVPVLTGCSGPKRQYW